MRKFICVFLVSVYLFSNSEAKQFLKIPKLIEHFYNHKERDASTTLISFLKLHYLDDHGKDADYKEDMKLPFKTHDSHCHAITTGITTPPKTLEICIDKSIFLLEKRPHYVYTEPITNLFNMAVFRPPVFL